MNESTDLDRLLTAWLTADAPIREPELLLERVLTRTARTRRRTAWRIPERWLAVSTISTRIQGASRFPWRTAAVVALIVVALTMGALVIAGSRATPVPAPFGPAHNGRIVYSTDGDIVAIDSPGAAPRTIIGGATFDSGPVYSPDGLTFAFIRGQMASSDAELWAADADGSNPRRLAAVPFVSWAEWSPQADVVAVSMDSDKSVIRMVAADGSGSIDIQTGLSAAENATFRPSDGKQMTFRGQATDGTWGIYLIGRDGSDMQRLDLDPGFATDEFYDINRDYYFFGPAWSPEGTRLMYHTLEPDPTSPAGPGFRIHVADIAADGAIDAERTLEFDRSADDEYGATWLPSGDGIVFQSIEGSLHREWVADLASGSQARDLAFDALDDIGVIVSPDGRQIVASVPAATADQPSVSIVDLTTLATTPVAASDDLVWQRTAR